MAKQAPIKLEGIVVKSLPNSRYEVALAGNESKVIIARKSGRRYVNLVEGSRVMLELPQADPSRGRIVKKLNNQVTS